MASAPGLITTIIITAIATLQRFGAETMATPSDYTAVANVLVRFFTEEVQRVPEPERSFIPMEKIPAAAGATAKVAVDALDAFRAKEKT